MARTQVRIAHASMSITDNVSLASWGQLSNGTLREMYESKKAFLIIIKVFVKRKISHTHTHTGTCTHEHTDYTKLNLRPT